MLIIQDPPWREEAGLWNGHVGDLEPQAKQL
jgi:hypothetical protein